MTRRILRDLRIDKVAAVDRPCQEHASADIMKRDFTQEERDSAARSGHALPDGSYPINTVEDLHNAIRAISRAKNEAEAKAHIISRAKSLGATDQLPESWSTKESTVLKELAKALGLPDTATEADVTKALADNITKGTATAAALAKSELVAKMNDKEKAHMAKLATDAERDAFLKATPEEKTKQMASDDDSDDAAVTKALSSGNAFKTPEGIVITKAKVGEELYTVLKNQNDRVEKAEKTAADSIEKAAVTDFVKRATDIGFGADFGPTLRKAYGGDATAQLEVEKRITGLQEQVSQGKMFSSFGKASPAEGSAEEELLAKVAEVQKNNPKLKPAQAYSKVYTDPANSDIVKRMKAEATS